MKGGGARGIKLIHPPGKTTLKKPSFIRVKLLSLYSGCTVLQMITLLPMVTLRNLCDEVCFGVKSKKQTHILKFICCKEASVLFLGIW